MASQLRASRVGFLTQRVGILPLRPTYDIVDPSVDAQPADDQNVEMVKVSIRYLMSGERVGRFLVPRDDTIASIMQLIRRQRGIRITTQNLVLPVEGNNVIIKNKFLTAGDLKPPSWKKARLCLMVSAPDPCACCGEMEPHVRLHRCPGCLDVFYCSALCQTTDWPLHRLGCARQWSA
jgi:hypothetical protein